MTTLVIASGNAGKVREFGQLLEGLGLNTQPQPEGIEVEETGDTFAANARLKAEAVAQATGQWALADDSGLSVDALGGAPGVHSARYAATDAERIERLLDELSRAGALDPRSRSACFTAALAVADPKGRVVLEVEGHCRGWILTERRGNRGFGYDPIFYVPEAKLTFAEMPKAMKAALGHRGRAVKKARGLLEELTTSTSLR